MNFCVIDIYPQTRAITYLYLCIEVFLVLQLRICLNPPSPDYLILCVLDVDDAMDQNIYVSSNENHIFCDKMCL